MGTSTVGVKRILITLSLLTGALFPVGLVVWKHTAVPSLFGILIIAGCALLTLVLLWLRLSFTELFWIRLWGVFAPVLVTSLFALPSIPIVPVIFILPPLLLLIGLWGAYRFYPLRHDRRLHTARFARIDELRDSSFINHSRELVGTMISTNHLPK